jgi:hypothetical protein
VVDRALLWRRQFLNPFAFFDAPQGVRVPGHTGEGRLDSGQGFGHFQDIRV